MLKQSSLITGSVASALQILDLEATEIEDHSYYHDTGNFQMFLFRVALSLSLHRVDLSLEMPKGTFLILLNCHKFRMLNTREHSHLYTSRAYKIPSLTLSMSSLRNPL